MILKLNVYLIYLIVTSAITCIQLPCVAASDYKRNVGSCNCNGVDSRNASALISDELHEILESTRSLANTIVKSVGDEVLPLYYSSISVGNLQFKQMDEIKIILLNIIEHFQKSNESLKYGFNHFDKDFGRNMIENTLGCRVDLIRSQRMLCEESSNDLQFGLCSKNETSEKITDENISEMEESSKALQFSSKDTIDALVESLGQLSIVFDGGSSQQNTFKLEFVGEDEVNGLQFRFENFTNRLPPSFLQPELGSILQTATGSLFNIVAFAFLYVLMKFVDRWFHDSGKSIIPVNPSTAEQDTTNKTKETSKKSVSLSHSKSDEESDFQDTPETFKPIFSPLNGNNFSSQTLCYETGAKNISPVTECSSRGETSTPRPDQEQICNSSSLEQQDDISTLSADDSRDLVCCLRLCHLGCNLKNQECASGFKGNTGPLIDTKKAGDKDMVLCERSRCLDLTELYSCGPQDFGYCLQPQISLNAKQVEDQEFLTLIRQWALRNEKPDFENISQPDTVIILRLLLILLDRMGPE